MKAIYKIMRDICFLDRSKAYKIEILQPVYQQVAVKYGQVCRLESSI